MMRLGNDVNARSRHGWKFFGESCHEWSTFPYSQYMSLYFLHAMICFEHTNKMKTNIDRSFHHCGKGSLFRYCDVTCQLGTDIVASNLTACMFAGIIIIKTCLLSKKKSSYNTMFYQSEIPIEPCCSIGKDFVKLNKKYWYNIFVM